MNQQWVDNKYLEYVASIETRRQHLRQAIENQHLFTEESRREYLEIVDKNGWTYEDKFNLEMMHILGLPESMSDNEAITTTINEWAKTITDDIYHIYEYYSYYRPYNQNPYHRLLDSISMYFDGDVIITDPCYIMRKRDESDKPSYRAFMRYPDGEYPDRDPYTKHSDMFEEDWSNYDEAIRDWEKSHPDDWDTCEMGENMEKLGFTTYMTRDTLYGDWSCTTFNNDTKQSIGKFCADAGLVSVFLLSEIMKYNPNYDVKAETKYAATLIKNFRGHIQFIVTEETGTYEKDSPYHKAGDTWVDHSVQVVGHGINSSTNEPMNFITTQTGF